MQYFTNIILALAAAASLASSAPLSSRQDGATMAGDLTFYTPGLGACGFFSSEDDAVVALSWELFDQFTPNGNPNLNSLCGRRIRINLGGNSAEVTVADRCTGCASNDLDVPVKVFSSLANPDDGRVQMSWTWI